MAPAELQNSKNGKVEPIFDLDIFAQIIQTVYDAYPNLSVLIISKDPGMTKYLKQTVLGKRAEVLKVEGHQSALLNDFIHKKMELKLQEEKKKQEFLLANIIQTKKRSKKRRVPKASS